MLYELGAIEMIKEIKEILTNIFIKIKMVCLCKSSCQVGKNENDEKGN